MEALRTASCPSSFQLRLGFRCRRSASILHLRMNFRPSGRRICSLSASSGSAAAAAERDGSEGGGDRIPSGNSWVSSGSAADSFSGWFDKDPSGDSERNRGFEGIVGAGLAGIFLAAGVTFASLALSKSTGLKKQMKPLTTQQEVLLACDDLNENDDQIGNVSTDNGRMQNDNDSGFKTGINLDSVSSIEINEATSDSRPDDNVHVGSSLIQNAESDCNRIDTFSKASSQEYLQLSPGVDAVSVPTGSNPISTNLVELDVVNGSSEVTFTDSHSFTGSDMQDPIIELEESQGTVEPLNLPVSSSDSTIPNVDPPDGSFFSVEIENSNLSSELVCASEGQLSTNPLTLDGLVTSESNANLESQVDSKDLMENVAPVSSENNFEVSEILKSPSEGICLPSEERNLIENGPPGTTSASVSEDLYNPDTNAQSEISRSRSLFELPVPENSYSFAGIPAPSLVSAALQVPPGKILVPAVVDQVQGQALSALQILKVIEAGVKPGDLCTRREYARWLVSASSVLSRNSISKVYPAMYIENVTELAFDDVSPEDPDFPSIQGLAEAGLISSKLSRQDMHQSLDGGQVPVLFSPESPLSRQDLVSWKMVLERKQLPEVDKKILSQCSGFIDIEKISPDAWPAIVADISSGDQSIMALAFGFTRLFQPDKPVTKAQVAIALATGEAAELVSEEVARIEAESMAETAVAAHTALVAQVEKDLNASFEKALAMEKEKIDALEKLAAEARLELERLRAERNEENDALMLGRAAVESEMEILTTLRREVEGQLQSLMSDKMEIAFEKDRINKLCQEAESENQGIAKLQYDLEVERKALSMARAWAEDEAKRVREHAKALEEARDRWERHGIKVVVDSDLRDDATAGVTWLNTGTRSPMEETVYRAENLVRKLKAMASEIKGKSSIVIEEIIQRIKYVILVLKQKAVEAARNTQEFRRTVALKVSSSMEEFQQNAAGFSSNVKDGAKRLAGDCRDGVEKITQKFKI